MILQVKHLHKSFGGIHASNDINLELDAWQTHAVVGPNGAGKTTLINQLSGTLRPDRGDIIFNGKNISNSSAHQRAHDGLARSFQITSVIMPMTLLENVALAVQSISGHSFHFWKPAVHETQVQVQAQQYLQAVGLGKRANMLAAEVSHGEHRQLEIAMSLALKPTLLLLDEPTAGMGKEETLNLIDLLKSLKDKITILLVEHDMDTVFALADRISVLVNGHIIASGEPDSIRQNPDVQKAYLGEAQP